MIPGRSDNDVKNRWHSKTRSQKYKRAIAAQAQGSVDAITHAPGKKWDKLKSSNDNEEGTIANVLKRGGADETVNGKTIRMSDGIFIFLLCQCYIFVNSVRCDAPNDEGVKCFSRNSDTPKKSYLSANEISLCHELLKMQSKLRQSVKADNTTKDNCTEVEAQDGPKNQGATMSTDIDGLESVKADNTTADKAVGTKKKNAFMSTDIDSLANIVARKLTKGELSIPKIIDSVGNRPASKVPPLTTTSDIAEDTKKGGDLGIVLWDDLSEWPTSGIQKPGDNDCLIGRGGA